jgi:hypothetical protein
MSSATSKQFPYGFPNQVGVTGTTEAGPLLQDVPTSPTDLVTKDSYLFQASFTNGTAGAISVTIADRQASAKYAMELASIPANTAVAFNWSEGIFMKGGITWSAASGGIDGSVVAFYRN